VHHVDVSSEGRSMVFPQSAHLKKKKISEIWFSTISFLKKNTYMQ
jgi:hypothetical protein